MPGRLCGLTDATHAPRGLQLAATSCWNRSSTRSDVDLGLGDVRDVRPAASTRLGPALYAARASSAAPKRSQLRPQVPRPADEVLVRIPGVDPEPGGGRGHELGQTHGTGGRQRPRVEGRFRPHESGEQPGVHPRLRRRARRSPGTAPGRGPAGPEAQDGIGPSKPAVGSAASRASANWRPGLRSAPAVAVRAAPLPSGPRVIDVEDGPLLGLLVADRGDQILLAGDEVRHGSRRRAAACASGCGRSAGPPPPRPGTGPRRACRRRPRRRASTSSSDESHARSGSSPRRRGGSRRGPVPPS